MSLIHYVCYMLYFFVKKGFSFIKNGTEFHVNEINGTGQ